jgi:hypothetical protein
MRTTTVFGPVTPAGLPTLIAREGVGLFAAQLAQYHVGKQRRQQMGEVVPSH